MPKVVYVFAIALLGTSALSQEVLEQKVSPGHFLVEMHRADLTVTKAIAQAKKVLEPWRARDLVAVVRLYSKDNWSLDTRGISHVAYETLRDWHLRADPLLYGVVAEAICYRESAVLRVSNGADGPKLFTLFGDSNPLDIETKLGKGQIVHIVFHNPLPTRRDNGADDLDLYLTSHSPLSAAFGELVVDAVRSRFKYHTVRIWIASLPWFPFAPSYPLFHPLVGRLVPPIEDEYAKVQRLMCEGEWGREVCK